MATKSHSGDNNALRNELLKCLPHISHESQRASFLAEHPELLNSETISWLSDLIRDQSKVNTAVSIPLAQVAMTIARRLRDKSAMARSLRAMGNALYLAGQNKSAVRYHSKARVIFAALRDRRELARTLSASTQPLILTGRYPLALSNARHARRMLASLHDQGRVARLDVNIGNILHRQDRFAEALQWYRRAHRYFLRDEEKDPEGMATALHNIAMCLVSLNDFHGAVAAHRETRAVAAKNGMAVLVAQADYNIAALHFLRGEYGRAIGMLLSTRKSCKENNDPYHVALCNLDLSEIYLQLNLGAPAEEMAEEAWAGFQKLGMGYEAGKSLVNLALAMARQNKPRQALRMLGKARIQFIREKNFAWPFLADLYKGAILVEQRRHHEAQCVFLAAEKFFQRNRIPSKIAESQLLLSRSYLLSGKPTLAKRQCSRALRLLGTTDLPVLSCRAQRLMGQINLAQGAKEKAYLSYQKARALLEQTRRGLHNEEMKMSFMQDKLEIYEALIDLCLEPEQRLEEAFEYVEESKSRVLQDQMSFPQSLDSAPDSDTGTQREALELRAQINWYNRKLTQEQLRGSQASHELIANYQTAISKRENQILRLVREMPVSEALSAGLASSKPATIDEIREALPPDATLIEYFQVRGKLLAAILTPQTFDITPLTDAQPISALFDLLLFQLSKFRLGEEYTSKFAEPLLRTTQRHLRQLHDNLFAPIETRLQAQHLVIVPHGVLHRVPFQALFDGQQYLIEKFSISYAPSATIHALCCKRPINRQGPALVMGVPDQVAPLIKDEARSVAAIVPRAELLLEGAATAEVLRTKGPLYRFIHIATHGYFRQNSPMFSGIRLGDSVLSLMDLYRFKLPAELITLSGCATGLSTVGNGDELLGLVRGLIYAGAGSALLTLWDVHDASTLEFMTTFYDHLMAGANKAIALQRAANELRARYPHPYYWAPFSLVGNSA